METKTIRVDKEVFNKLVENVKGFETPNAVLRRLLGLDKSNKKSKR